MASIIKSVFEKVLFPAPNPPHYTSTSHEEYLFWLPTDSNPNSIPPIPCMLYSPSQDAHLFIIWCHGNACDIGTMNKTLMALSQRVSAHVLIFEYPSYGLLRGIKRAPNELSINKHAECAYLFVRDYFQWPSDRIIIYGHSIGSGAACHLASTQSVGGLILQSPYTAIESLIQEKIGCLSKLVSCSFWNNSKALENVTCPTLFIHGERDILIPSHHSQTLYESLNRANKCLILLPNDDHNSISDSVMLKHVSQFLNKYFPPTEEKLRPVEIHAYLRKPSPFTMEKNAGPPSQVINPMDSMKSTFSSNEDQ